MRVALVQRNVHLGGSLERHVVLLARALASRGVDVHVYCNPDTSLRALDGVTFHEVRPFVRSRSRFGYPVESGSFAAEATRRLRRDRHGYDIVHVSGIAAWEHDIVTVHGVTKAGQRRWPEEDGRRYRAAHLRARLGPVLRPQLAVSRTIQRLQFRPGRFRRVIAVSEGIRRDIEETYGVDGDAIDVMTYPIEVERFKRDENGRLRASLGVRSEQRLLLFIGHDFERKGLAEAIKALAAVGPDAELVVVGTGDVRRFGHIAREAGVRDRVHFVGGTDEPERFFGGVELLVLPTRHDPWGVPLVEAMAAGVPVVTTEAAGAAAEVRRAGAGVVLADASSDELGKTISALLADPDALREMGERGRSAAARFGLDAFGDSVLATYDLALHGGARAGVV